MARCVGFPSTNGFVLCEQIVSVQDKGGESLDVLINRPVASDLYPCAQRLRASGSGLSEEMGSGIPAFYQVKLTWLSLGPDLILRVEAS
jgi:hypothetical protein